MEQLAGSGRADNDGKPMGDLIALCQNKVLNPGLNEHRA